MIKLNSNVSSKLSEAVINKLQRTNVSTVLEFMLADSEKLRKITGLSHKDVSEVKQNISNAYSGKIINGHDLFNTVQSNRILTGIKSVDVLLDGGLRPGQIYELCGLTACGKTQLCFTIACNIALKYNSIVRYVDTKKDFCGSRIEEILTNKNISKQVLDEVMERVKVCYVENMCQLLQVLHWLRTVLKEGTQELCTRIIIIESLPALVFKFSKDHATIFTLTQLASICRYLADEFNLTIIIVNIITQWNYPVAEDEASNIVKEHTIVTPALGKYWSRIANTRLYLQKDEQGRMKIVVWKSSGLETNTACLVNLDMSGVN